MKIDQLVIKRFGELLEKAEEVERTRESVDWRETVEREKFEAWATSVMSLLQRVFGEESVHFINFKAAYGDYMGWASEYESCRGIFKAAKEDYECGYLFRVKSLVSAEVLEDVLEQSTELLKAGYKDPASVIAGVALETVLKDLCTKNNISHGKLDRMNTDLCKAGIYNMGMQKQITAWADRRNNAAHGNWDEYSSNDVDDLIKGVRRFIAEYM